MLAIVSYAEALSLSREKNRLSFSSEGPVRPPKTSESARPEDPKGAYGMAMLRGFLEISGTYSHLFSALIWSAPLAIRPSANCRREN